MRQFFCLVLGVDVLAGYAPLSVCRYLLVRIHVREIRGQIEELEKVFMPR